MSINFQSLAPNKANTGPTSAGKLAQQIREQAGTVNQLMNTRVGERQDEHGKKVDPFEMNARTYTGASLLEMMFPIKKDTAGYIGKKGTVSTGMTVPEGESRQVDTTVGG